MFIPVLIIFLLLLINAFFVVAEFAIVGVPRSAIDTRASRNDRLAKLVQGVLDDPRRRDRYIATAQIGITVASLGLGMYGEHVVADWILEAIGDSGWAQWLAAHGFASIVAVMLGRGRAFLRDWVPFVVIFLAWEAMRGIADDFGAAVNSDSVIAAELRAAEAGPILRRYVDQVRITAPFFDAKRNDPVEAFVAEADRHPVFRLTHEHSR